jgi:hypothetical protein
VFSRTGGLHAAGLFTSHGKLIVAREDVGRHNAVDKIVGWALLNNALPLVGCALLVSGRASSELVRKAVLACISLLAAVSAPSPAAAPDVPAAPRPPPQGGASDRPLCAWGAMARPLGGSIRFHDAAGAGPGSHLAVSFPAPGRARSGR